MQQYKNVKCTNTKQRKPDWTEEVKFHMSQGDYKDEFLNMKAEL